MNICDMCGIPVQKGQCGCGTWEKNEEMENHPIKKALEYFHDMEQFTLTSDMPHLGCAVIYFRGDYIDCKKIEAFIHKMKGRPYYEDKN